ncbi:HNH endonuclease [Bdellovibrio sp. KM01]|uniref:HNH endonuclease n=1 Tax=Bdellovibrio sp. KM01 TaxID=2748865 RepID=UPI0015E933B7|nr:HNH endonuclease signature motif containing protein [Bdellovibrio sp. KM01]QLY26886.1 HNH endonuclease [Bdellovibrio sp. KM01]
MNLTGICNLELIGRLEKLAQSERKLTHLILCHINEMESRRLYAELGFDSMFRYLTTHLKYSEDAAYRRLSAARLLKKSPEIAERLEDGRLTLTQLTQVQSALRQEIKKSGEDSKSLSAIVPQILKKIESKSSFETKKTLAQEFNFPIVTIENMIPQRDDSVRLEITLTTEQLKTLETARDLMSHVLPDGNWAELLTLLAQKQIQKILGKEACSKSNSRPVTLNKEQGAKNTYRNPPTETKSLSTKPNQIATKKSTRSFLVARKRGHIKVTSKREILISAGYCCEYEHPISGVKCGSKFQLQFDHIQPVALGGSDGDHNLRVLCRTHNIAEGNRMGLKCMR